MKNYWLNNTLAFGPLSSERTHIKNICLRLKVPEKCIYSILASSYREAEGQIQERIQCIDGSIAKIRQAR
jgi:hypothetical protein